MNAPLSAGSCRRWPPQDIGDGERCYDQRPQERGDRRALPNSDGSSGLPVKNEILREALGLARQENVIRLGRLDRYLINRAI